MLLVQANARARRIYMSSQVIVFPLQVKILLYVLVMQDERRSSINITHGIILY